MKLLVVAGALALSAWPASAQTDFSGTWTLDRAISADPSRATFEPAPEKARRSTGGLTGSVMGLGMRRGAGGRGGPDDRGGSGRGEAGGERGDGSIAGGAAALTVDEHTRLHELADYVRGLTALVIVHSDRSTFEVTDALGRSRLFPTDGGRTPHTFATATIDSSTKWDGPHMVTVYKIGPAHDLVFTYILVPATRQMALRIRLEESGRPRADVPEIRLVYKLKPAPPLTYDAAGGGHLLRAVTDEGRYITLEDGSRWEVVPEDRFTSVDWQPDAVMAVRVVHAAGASDYQLVNTTDDGGVRAKLLSPR